MSRYLVLDGADGCGKSEQARRLTGWLARQGRPVVHLREPGSTPVGETLRRLLLDRATGAMAPLADALLFSAARAEMVRIEVRPALARGATVVAERCYLSTYVYQGLAADPPVDPGLLRAVTAAAHDGCWPDAVFVLDVDAATSRARRRVRGQPDRFEAQAAEFLERVCAGFRAAAAAEPRARLVDARGDADSVFALLQQAVVAL